MKAKAVITTKWEGTAYKPVSFDNIETYFVDTSIDNDADAFQITLGDPSHDMIDCLTRDNEVRVQIFGAGYGAKLLLTGFADEVTYDETGTLTINGRDLSSLATDNVIAPALWQHVRAGDLIKQQATTLGFKGPFHITTAGTVKKLEYTDASESYWDFWYRLVRKDKMYIWTGPDGSLWTGFLNYAEDPPLYYFGVPPKTASSNEAAKYIPIETLEFRKGNQNRIAKVWAYGQQGTHGLGPVYGVDEEISDWIKKPRKIMLDTDAHSLTALKKIANEEIYESKVGALELRITIPDPGYVIDQDHMCHINVPAMGLSGDWYVVGTRVQSDTRGFVQEVRLREKGFALTKRVPADPKITDQPTDAGLTGLAGNLSLTNHSEWSSYFVKAAREWHGGWDFSLYLATLLAICQQETGFLNERRNGGPGGDHHEWYPPPGDPQSQHGHDSPGGTTDSPGGVGVETLEHWKTKFANIAGDGYVTEDYAVGPMQLLSIGFKYDADDLYKTGHRNEFTGGRWHPQWNIMAGAHALREKLQATVRDSFRDVDIWKGVAAYGEGEAYAEEVKAKVYNPPFNFLQAVKDAQAQTHTDEQGAYVNPFRDSRGLVVGQVDMGVDYSGGQHSNIVAIGDAKIIGIGRNWYKTQPYLLYQLKDGTHQGKYIYVAEGIDVLVSPGDSVNKGQAIARFNQDPENASIETGWGSSTLSITLAAKNGHGGPERHAAGGTAEGRDFARFLRNLNAPAPDV